MKITGNLMDPKFTAKAVEFISANVSIAIFDDSLPDWGVTIDGNEVRLGRLSANSLGEFMEKEGTDLKKRIIPPFSDSN